MDALIHYYPDNTGALLGTIPYIALQLKAVGQTFNIMAGSPTGTEPSVLTLHFSLQSF